MQIQTTIGIIGGGPAGAATALYLVDQGVAADDILIIDRASFPRQKLCGGGIPWRSVHLVEQLVGKPAYGWETDGLSIRLGEDELFAREPGKQWLYDRAYLDNILLAKCRQRGVRVKENMAIHSVERSENGWTCQSRTQTYVFRWLVGADGALGVVARKTKLGSKHTGSLVEGVYQSDEDGHSLDQLVMNFDPLLDGIPGYAWIFPYPRGDGTLLWKLGIMDASGCISGERLRNWVCRYAEMNGFRLIGKLKGWAERYFHRDVQAHTPGLVLTGEAWGVDPLLGEGIGPALHMAQYTARRLAKAVEQGRQYIPDYESGFMRTREGQNLLFQGAVANAVYTRGGDMWLKAALKLPGLEGLTSRRLFAFGRLFPIFAPLLTYGKLAKWVFGGQQDLPARHIRRRRMTQRPDDTATII